MRTYVFDEHNLSIFLIQHALSVVIIMTSLSYVHLRQTLVKPKC